MNRWTAQPAVPWLRSDHPSGADWQSVPLSGIASLRGVPALLGAPISFRCPADCESAIRQITNLRYAVPLSFSWPAIWEWLDC